MLSDNKDKISDQLWFDLVEQRIEDIKKISKHTNMTPDWSVVDTRTNITL
jgi:hypothetical protein